MLAFKTDLTILKNSDLELLKEHFSPHTKRIYLVGGCVRDAFLGRESSDFDVEIFDIDILKFDEIMQKLGANGVGKSFFIYKFKNIDIGLGRIESKTGQKHTDFSVSLTQDERTASKRRDFTINSIMINLFDGKVLDFWGGLADLRAKILRHIDDEKFVEDPLRVLRGVQFCARFNLKIAPKTIKLMKNLSLDNLSKDRVSTELLKFFKAPFLEVGAFYLEKLGLLKTIFNAKIPDFDAFLNLVKNAKKFIKDERLFFYLLANFANINLEATARNLNLPKSYFLLKDEPFFIGEISDENLATIALKKPLNSWLGCYDEGRIKRAKELGIYEQKISFNPQELVKSGLKGDLLKQEINRLKEREIAKFLAHKSL
ncbi:CCA tRNA nucleotidyltransferase [Campylobacter gastrosuis]|uniref:CCA tRNA nucleotidyltransferase n=1 Tax=Campylobacter gastrosuis TaxID=2974576 RepID=A0ABT7HNV8_9BACT|nr:CCA tRNA nucleotidyltransferase [Campylobacter gastrosuis]MDL0088605.1 CCA tRNA nucleotidyltransferase [Campylobacter gastrosuis]